MNNSFDYPFWLSLLSTNGFKHCRYLIYPLLKYRYMSIDKVRPIDISEKLFERTSAVKMADGGATDDTLLAYVAALQDYILHYFKYRAGSRAERYAKHTDTLIKGINEGKDRLDNLLTLFAIYIGLARELYPNFETKEATNISLHVDKNDAELLVKLRKHPFKKTVPGLPLLPGREEKQSQERKNVIYMHNVLMWGLLMDSQGKFDEEENQNG